MLKNSYDFVLDCSFAMAWFFEDENNDYTNFILENIKNTISIVPSIWPLEVANVLLQSKRKKRINEIQSASFIDALAALPIIVDQSTTSRAMHSIFVLADQANLTIYDAAYLELAIREEIPLLTLDQEIIKAAQKHHIPINPIKIKN